jgi:hypothetical protein
LEADETIDRAEATAGSSSAAAAAGAAPPSRAAAAEAAGSSWLRIPLARLERHPGAYRVVAAVVAEWLPTLAPPLGDQGFSLPYVERTKVELDVSPAETLYEVRRRAVTQLRPVVTGPEGYSLDSFDALYWCWFYEDADEHGINSVGRYQQAEDLVTVDQTGLAQWHRRAEEILYADLVRAGNQGLIRGDPLRPYIVLLYPQGGDILATAWEAALHAWSILGSLLTARELYGLGRETVHRLRARTDTGRKVLLGYRDEWSTRRAGPSDIARVAWSEPWALGDLRVLLGLETREQAVELLALFGLKPGCDGTSALDESDEAMLLRLIAEDILSHSSLHAPELSADEWRARLVHLLSTRTPLPAE